MRILLFLFGISLSISCIYGIIFLGIKVEIIFMFLLSIVLILNFGPKKIRFWFYKKFGITKYPELYDLEIKLKKAIREKTKLHMKYQQVT